MVGWYRLPQLNAERCPETRVLGAMRRLSLDRALIDGSARTRHSPSTHYHSATGRVGCRACPCVRFILDFCRGGVATHTHGSYHEHLERMHTAHAGCSGEARHLTWWSVRVWRARPVAGWRLRVPARAARTVVLYNMDSRPPNAQSCGVYTLYPSSCGTGVPCCSR